MPMRLPRNKAAWLTVAAVVVVFPFFVSHPVELVWLIGAGLILLTAWQLMFGSAKGPKGS